MFTVSKQKADQRWEVLTPSLREALFSDVNGDFVWNLCQDNHLTEEKSYRVAEFAGFVLYGFLHPEDLSGELVKSLDLPAPLAKTLSDAINTRIFAPLKADLDKVYSPLIKAEEASVVPAGPKVIQSASPATGPKPTILSDVGWSRMPPSAPVAPRATAPAPAPTPEPAPVTPPRPSVPAPVAPTKPAEPAPIMLHEDTAFKAVEKNAGFTLSRPAAGAEVHMAQNVTPPPPRSAVLEFGGAKPPIPNKPSATTSSSPSLSAVPTVNAGPRNVSQITPPAAPTPQQPPAPPKPPTPVVPQPPQPPKPPSPPQGDKPIVKDFL